MAAGLSAAVLVPAEPAVPAEETSACLPRSACNPENTPLPGSGSDPILCEDAAELVSRLPDSQRLLALPGGKERFAAEGLRVVLRITRFSRGRC